MIQSERACVSPPFHSSLLPDTYLKLDGQRLFQAYQDSTYEILKMVFTPMRYSKTCVKRPLLKRAKIGFQDLFKVY